MEDIIDYLESQDSIEKEDWHHVRKEVKSRKEEVSDFEYKFMQFIQRAVWDRCTEGSGEAFSDEEIREFRESLNEVKSSDLDDSDIESLTEDFNQI